MSRPKALTLVELLIVTSIIAILLAMMLPSLASAQAQARLVACAAGMHDIHVALSMYSLGNSRKMPPFAFSDHGGDLPLSGFWGGASQANDPDAFGRLGVGCVNLWSLVREGLAPRPG